ncbi:MAG: hypothetical protein LUG50_13370 [Planctomycetaceae bacterium]|nr:hypothetical protein [Planctomycetaceae bacterium]
MKVQSYRRSHIEIPYAFTPDCHELGRRINEQCSADGCSLPSSLIYFEHPRDFRTDAGRLYYVDIDNLSCGWGVMQPVAQDAYIHLIQSSIEVSYIRLNKGLWPVLYHIDHQRPIIVSNFQYTFTITKSVYRLWRDFMKCLRTNEYLDPEAYREIDLHSHLGTYFTYSRSERLR